MWFCVLGLPYNARPFKPRLLHVMAKKLFVKTHGCQMNEYDSARMHDVLREQGDYELVTDENEADVILLNTCSIREKHRKKSSINWVAGNR